MIRHSLALVGALACTGSAGAADINAACRAIATKARAASPAGLQQGVSDPRSFLKPIVQVAPEVELPPDRMSQVVALFSEPPATANVKVQPLGGGEYRTSQLQGTAHCLEEHYVKLDPGGGLHELRGPKDAETEMCWNSWREATRAQGAPALMRVDQLDQPQLGVDVQLTDWRSGLGPSCRVSIRARDAFVTSETFCNGDPLCRSAVILAPLLAAAFAHDPDRANTLAQVSPPTPAQASIYAPKLINAPLSGDPIPSFGVKPKTEYPNFTIVSVALASVDGHVLVAAVGRGGFGWREIGDYLVAFYTPSTSTPVASAVVKRRIIGLASAAISAP